MPSPGRIVSSPRLYERARSKTSADPAVYPLLQAHVLFTQLDAEGIEGDGSASQRARCARPHQFPSQRHLEVVQPLLTDDLVFEHPSRTCSAQMRIRISSRVRRAVLPDREYLRFSSLSFLFLVLFLPFFILLFSSSSLLSCFFLLRPSLFPGSRERRVRHAPRPLALPPSRAGLLHDTEHDAPSGCEATTRLFDAPRAYDHTMRGISPRTPYHVHALKGEQHLTTAHPRYDTQQALPFLHTRAAHVNLRAWQRSAELSPSRPMCPIFPYRIHRFHRFPPTTTISGAAPFSRSPNYHLHHHPRAQRSQWLFFIAGAAPFFCPRSTTIDASPLRLPGLPSMQEHPHTPDALPAHTGTQTHNATGMRPRLKQQEAIVARPRRDAATRTSVMPHLPPPFFRLISPRLAPSALRRLSQGTVHSATTPRDIPRDYEPAARCARCTARLRRRLMRAIAAHPSPDPHRQPHGQRMTLAFLVPHTAFVVSPRCATVLTSVPPSPLDPHACRGLQDHPQHLPRLQRVSRSFLIAGAAFVAFSYATTIYCPHRSTRAAGQAHPQHNTDIPSTYGSLSPPRTSRSSPPPAPWHPGTHHEHDAHALHVAYPCAVTVFSAAPPSVQSQHTPQLSPITHATFVPSPRAHHLQRRSALTARLPCLHVLRYSPQHHLRAPRTFPTVRAVSIASDHRADPFRHPTARPTPALPVYSTKTSATPARGAACADGVDPQRYDAPAKSAQAHGDDVQPPLEQQLR
ncbi:hypothetical protein B0H13DRAFT_2664696 [Mycena leptocephala]|nr:hypothetical protein B0H13DRAFT_2664696 [Mycena leptocephala]